MGQAARSLRRVQELRLRGRPRTSPSARTAARGCASARRSSSAAASPEAAQAPPRADAAARRACARRDPRASAPTGARRASRSIVAGDRLRCSAIALGSSPRATSRSSGRSTASGGASSPRRSSTATSGTRSPRAGRSRCSAGCSSAATARWSPLVALRARRGRRRRGWRSHSRRSRWRSARNGAALALLCAWAMPDLRPRRGLEYDGDLLGAGVRGVLLLMRRREAPDGRRRGLLPACSRARWPGPRHPALPVAPRRMAATRRSGVAARSTAGRAGPRLPPVVARPVAPYGAARSPRDRAHLHRRAGGRRRAAR